MLQNLSHSISYSTQIYLAVMTLDVLSFIDSKGGNAEEIRESQRKRGHSVELVDLIVQMYADWVKCKGNDSFDTVFCK